MLTAILIAAGLVDQINWTNFLNKNVYVVAENVKLHPLFRDE